MTETRCTLLRDLCAQIVPLFERANVALHDWDAAANEFSDCSFFAPAKDRKPSCEMSWLDRATLAALRGVLAYVAFQWAGAVRVELLPARNSK